MIKLRNDLCHWLCQYFFTGKASGTLFGLLGITAILNSSDLPAQETDTRNKYALLVGCTVYPNLDKKFHLVGPANDVQLTKRLLVERFQFPKENVVILADSEGDDQLLPTRANIEREWKSLANRAKKGDQLVVLMAGHGTQCPQGENVDPDDREYDGLDEMFLPRDVGPWNDTIGSVENGIKDDDIRKWIVAIQKKEADLWLIVDACHSGTMSREKEVSRTISSDGLGVPKSLVDKAHATAKAEGTDQKTETSQVIPSAAIRGSEGNDKGPVLVALYAAESVEPTIEKKFPERGKDAKYYGLLTYTINEVLTQTATELTYRELVREIHSRYKRVSPTPMLEGDRDRLVLGSEVVSRPRLVVSRGEDDDWQINGGSLSGLSRGSVVAVYPPATAANSDEPIGHAKITDEGFKPLESRIEPVEFRGIRSPTVAKDMRCELVYLDYGDHRFRIRADKETNAGERVSRFARGKIQTLLKVFADKYPHLVEVVDDPRDADWLVQFDSLESRNAFLVPIEWQGTGDDQSVPRFGPAGEKLDEWLAETLPRIARVESLLRVAGRPDDQFSDGPKLQVDLMKGEDELVKYEQGLNLYVGDEKVWFRLINTGNEAIDVTLLAIDDKYGIFPVFPLEGEVNRLYPKSTVKTDFSIKPTMPSLQPEHLVVIAVKAKPVSETADFTFLAQESLEAQRSNGGDEFNSPLGQIFQNAFHGQGGKRGFSNVEIDNYRMFTLTWNTIERPKP